jgi:hypothetical protein
MEGISSTMFGLMVTWGVVTAALICLWIYRGTLEAHEDDQIFLDAAGDSMAREQRLIVERIDKLSRPITLLIVASSVLLVVIAGMWLYEGFQKF